MRPIILITGGIGAGKSVVSRIIRTLGYEVYDCDSRAKQLMDRSDDIKQRLVTDIHPQAVDADGSINRQLIAQVVFGDPERLNALNKIVHQAVIDDIWYIADGKGAPLFVETAIPRSSHLDALATQIWQVSAPVHIRLQRVLARDHHDKSHILSRMRAQDSEQCHGTSVHNILNDGTTPILPQIQRLFKQDIF